MNHVTKPYEKHTDDAECDRFDVTKGLRCLPQMPPELKRVLLLAKTRTNALSFYFRVLRKSELTCLQILVSGRADFFPPPFFGDLLDQTPGD